jgi:hypothetical protein
LTLVWAALAPLLTKELPVPPGVTFQLSALLEEDKLPPGIPSPPPPVFDRNGKRTQASVLGESLREAVLRGNLMGFPVIQNALRQYHHEPLNYSTFKEIRKSFQENGDKGPFTKGIIDSLRESYQMTSGDWQHLSKTCLEAPQYLT